MKKLCIFILASVFCFGLFAATPKIPKNINYDETKPFTFISNDCLNSYSIIANVVNTKKVNEYKISFINHSLLINTLISIQISFQDEKQLNDFINNFDLSDIENEFSKLRKTFIQSNLQPDIYPKTDDFYDNKNIPTSIVYMVTANK